MKCQWKFCSGLINPETDRCIMCSRTIDHQKEEETEREKASANTAWMSNKSEIEKKSRMKRKIKLDNP